MTTFIGRHLSSNSQGSYYSNNQLRGPKKCPTHSIGGQMMELGKIGPEDAILEGLSLFGETVQDIPLVRSGAVLYKSLSEAFSAKWPVGETCSLAFPAMIIRPDIRTECFVAISTSHVIIAWKKGLLKKTVEHKVIPLKSITDVQNHVGSNSATRGASLITISAEDQTTIALPIRNVALGELVKSTLLGRTTN